MDFVSSTGIRIIGAAHTTSTHLEDVAAALTSLSLLQEKEAETQLHPGVRSRVTSLAPCGLRNAMVGISIAPAFLSLAKWAPFVHQSLSCGRGFLPSLPRRPFQPLRDAFLLSLNPPVD